GERVVSAENDVIAKVDAGGLTAGTRYVYRFRTLDGLSSPIGHTRTLPEGDVEQVRFAVVSCANYPTGYFNAYKAAATHTDIDATLHLGDYIYEYGMGQYGTEHALELGRAVKPTTEILSLDDYRTRYGLYRLDEDLQALHAVAPMIAIWDDHEIANNTWKTGAQNHDESEGSFEARLDAALQAYLEWLPIRENPEGKDRLYRSFDYGNLARLTMLDTRYIGRDEQLDFVKDSSPLAWPFNVTDPKNPIALKPGQSRDGIEVKEIPVPFDLAQTPPVPVTDLAYVSTLDPQNLPSGLSYIPDLQRFKTEKLDDPTRSILGTEQEAYLASSLRGSRDQGQTWQVLGQQVLMGNIRAIDFGEIIDPAAPINDYWRKRIAFYGLLAKNGMGASTDSWEGYPAARHRAHQEFIGGIDETNKGNVVVLAGDTHNAWASSLHQQDTGESVGVEFATSSITSAGMEKYISAAPRLIADKFVAASPDLHWMDASQRGYMVITLTKTQVRSDWFFVDTISSHDFNVRLAHTETAQVDQRSLDT
ncbi:MAG: alkaline phosphatase D family protein, partial [Parvibaculaceae bacterium]|nr:alkaline phosphatase D family protein [Parvibaculaceae bacterium]